MFRCPFCKSRTAKRGGCLKCLPFNLYAETPVTRLLGGYEPLREFVRENLSLLDSLPNNDGFRIGQDGQMVLESDDGTAHCLSTSIQGRQVTFMRFMHKGERSLYITMPKPVAHDGQHRHSQE